jgi:tRNA(Ile)-lysidine synthase
MLDKIRQTVQKFEMLKRGDHVIAAVSGGPDSVALLQALVLLSPDYNLTLTVAHLNHGLRGAESDAEEQLVRRLSRERGIPCTVKRVNLPARQAKEKRSLEDMGREERYTFFSNLAEEVGATRIAVGHHRGDQAETVLMHLIRGSGLEGLKGILPVREGIIIRPLLELDRKDILDFLRAGDLSFLEDSSNSEDQFLRNRVRHELIPLLQRQYNPRIVSTLNRTAEIVRREDDYLKSTARRILDAWQIPSLAKAGETTFEISKVLGLHEALQYRVIKALLESCVSLPYPVSSAHIQAILDLCRGRRPDGCLHLPGKIIVKRGYGMLTLAYRDGTMIPAENAEGERREKDLFCYSIEIPDRVEIQELGRTVKTSFAEGQERGHFEGERNVAFLDLDKVQLPLAVRNRREGDRFQPLGMAGTKKLKAWFIDEKIPRRQRNSIALVADRQSVIWITGMRLSERVRVNEKTRRIVKIEMI